MPFPHPGEILPQVKPYSHDLEFSKRRAGMVEHLCYTEDDLFNSYNMVLARSLHLIECHEVLNSPLRGELFEAHLDQVWRREGFEVAIGDASPENSGLYGKTLDGWAAYSYLVPPAEDEVDPFLYVTGVALHHTDLKDPESCKEAVLQANQAISKFAYFIYVLVTPERLPSSGLPCLRYDFIQTPMKKISLCLQDLTLEHFSKFDPEADTDFTLSLSNDQGSFDLDLTPVKMRLGNFSPDLGEKISTFWVAGL